MAFSGPAPELINSRLAMLSFVAALGSEIASDESGGEEEEEEEEEGEEDKGDGDDEWDDEDDDEAFFTASEGGEEEARGRCRRQMKRVERVRIRTRIFTKSHFRLGIRSKRTTSCKKRKSIGSAGTGLARRAALAPAPPPP
jgi:hypothetical protein